MSLVLTLETGSPALLVELKAAGMKHNVLGVPRLCQFFAPPRSRSGSKRQACPKMRSLPTGSQLSDYFLSTKSAGEPRNWSRLIAMFSGTLNPRRDGCHEAQAVQRRADRLRPAAGG